MEDISAGARVRVTTPGGGAFIGTVVYVDLGRCDVWPDSGDIRHFLGKVGVYRLGGADVKWRDRLTPVKNDGPPMDLLTAREVEVLHHVSEGTVNRRIAEMLSVTEDVVKGNLRQIAKKLGTSDRTSAVAYALRNRIIP